MYKPDSNLNYPKMSANKINKETKQAVNNIRKIANKAKNSNGKRRPRRGRNKNPNAYYRPPKLVKRSFNYNSVGGRFVRQRLPGVVSRYVNAVTDPVHLERAVKIPDLKEQPSHPFGDYIAFDNGCAPSFTAPDAITPNDLNVFLFVMTYGPNEYVPTTGTRQSHNLSIWGVNENGNPLFNDMANFISGNNYSQLWSFSAQIRLVSMGFKINSLIGMATNSDDQFVAKFITGQVQQGSLEQWANGGSSQSISEILKAGLNYAVYENNQGASSLFNTMQNGVTTLFEYYPQAILATTNDDGNFNTHGLYYPYILVEFRQVITPVSLTMQDLSKKDPNNYTKLEQRAYDSIRYNCGTVQQKIDYLYKDTTNYDLLKNTNWQRKFLLEHRHNDELKDDFVDFRVDSMKNHNKYNVAVTTSYTYALPITLDCRWWFECEVLQGNIIQALPSPVYYCWDELVARLSSPNAYAKTSDGHSFTDNWKRAMRYLKMINPSNVRKVGNYSTNMIKSTKQAVLDVQRALYE